MDFSQIKGPATILAPTYLHSILRKQMLQEATGKMGIQLCSLSTFFAMKYQSEPIEEIDVLFQYQAQIQLLPLTIYATIAQQLDFLKQCASFIKEMKFYHIPLTDLPIATPAQQELKTILTQLYPIEDTQDQANAVLMKYQDAAFEDVYLYDCFYDEKDLALCEWLKQRGAKRITLPHLLNTKHFYHAINKRKEVEGLAQDILRKQRRAEDINVIVCDPSYKALLMQVFHRYQIPLTILKQSRTSMVTKRFITLLHYYLTPNRETLLEVLDTNLFAIAHVHELIEYMQVFDKTLDSSFQHICKQAITSELIDEREMQRLLRLEEHAQSCRDVIKPYLDALQNETDVNKVFEIINEIATQNISPKDTQSVQTLRQIHQLLNNCMPYLHTKEALYMVIELLDECKESANDKQLHGVLVSDLNAVLPPRKTLVMLGNTQKAYPSFPAKNGIFDEAYVRNLSAYPTRKMRYEHHMHQLEHFLQTCEELQVFYPLGTYDGKGNEAALEMETFMVEKAIPYPLQENYLPMKLDFTISSDLAQRLFVKDQMIHGSISAFERYQQCPFAYFLRYGLRLQEQLDHAFSQSRIGTLSHAVLEKLVTLHGKAYATTTLAQVDALLTKDLDAMANVYPDFQTQYAIIKKRILTNITKNIEYLNDMETHSHVSPIKSEHEFWWDIILDQDTKMRLHGFIDRIDASNGFLRIIDYKSSTKSLSEQDVFSGLQLQLLTYSLVAHKEYQKDVLGAYYYSLKHDNIMMSAGKMKRRPVEYIPFEKSDYMDQWMTTKQLKGWTMNEHVDIIDDDGRHLYGVRQNKDGEIKARKTYDLAVIANHFDTIYKTIGSSIREGKIACEPTESACLFCPYGAICRFQGYPRKITPLVEIDDTIYKGGGDNDA